MKKALFIALLALGLMACNNTTPSKENADIPLATEQSIDSPEVDALLDSIITAKGLGSLKLGAKIPDTIPGYEILYLIYKKVDEDVEDVIVEVKKEDNLMLQIRPGYVDEMDATNDTIAGILIISDQFATAEGFHVGSSVHDILKKEGVRTYFNEKRVYIKDNGLTYLLKPEDYEGELPASTFENPTEIEQPTFKADAKVGVIGIFGE